ncbi:MAG TPA: enoyl-CoA hydratase-related protein [Acidimicrobiales bacterium]|nr:enoyl-CoA hydratase-related protein [Acidimicrobiales bacterium]
MIHVDADGPVGGLIIDRQHVRNAVDADALVELRAGLDQLVAADVRVVVLSGAGGHFCAGADLSTLEDRAFTVLLREVLDRIAGAPVPVIAALEGAALGLGTQLAISCDLRTATADAQMGIPAGRLGLMVDHETVARLSLLAGHGTAQAMLLGAEVVRGADAHRVGLVQRIGTVDDAREWASAIARLAPLAVGGHKVSLAAAARGDRAAPEARAAFDRAWASADLREGIAAFHERRPPAFEGR